MNEQEKRIQEIMRENAALRQENVKLRGWVVEAVAKACFNCEEYIPHDEKRCNGCSIKRMNEIQP